MLSIEYREFTLDERMTLGKLHVEFRPEQSVSDRLIGSAIVGLLVSGIPAALMYWVGLPDTIWMGTLICAMIVAMFFEIKAMWEERTEPRREHPERSPYLLDLMENCAEVLHCIAVDAVELKGTRVRKPPQPPYNPDFIEVDAAELNGARDRGPGYFLDLGDSTILFLQGEYLSKLPEGFPNGGFDVVRAPHSSHVFQVKCLGEPFAPSTATGLLPDVDYLPANGEILASSLPGLREHLRQLKQNQSKEVCSAHQVKMFYETIQITFDPNDLGVSDCRIIIDPKEVRLSSTFYPRASYVVPDRCGVLGQECVGQKSPGVACCPRCTEARKRWMKRPIS